MDRHTRRTVLLTLTMCCMRNILAEVLINELNPDSPSRVDTEEFIELYNNGASPVSLDGYVIVLYDGATNAAYGVIYLQGDTISPYGYYVIGSSVVQPTPNKVFDSSINILENGLDAVALYHGTASQYEVEMSVTSENLVDAIVYDNRGRTQSALIDVLTPNEGAVIEWSMHLQGQDESLSRCKGMDPRKSSQFQLSVLTPAAENNCIMEETPTLPGMFPNLPSFPPNVADIYPEIVINEFSVDSSSGQFIELYDGGVGEMALDGLIIVTYRGRTEASYGNPISLTGHMTDENGYFLIGQAHQEPHLRLRKTLRTNQSPNAIALYFNNPSDFAPLTPVTGANLIDAVVYGATADPQDSAVVSILSAGRTPLIQPVNQLNTSLSRCRSSERLNLNAFKSAAYTPGRDNVCPLPDFFINEVNVATGGTKTDQFVEIFDGGIGQQSLEGVALVLYNGANTKSYLVIDLSGFSTNAHGFCVVGWVNSTNVDVSVEFAAGIDFLQPGPNAVALHLGPAERFRRGSLATNFGLIDAVVYGSTPALDLLHILLPYQYVLNESGGSSSDSALFSISRCLCCQRLNSASFGIGPPTPGEINAGCIQNNVTRIETLDHYVNSIRINEIRISMQGLPRGDFVEIFDGGFGGVPLANLVLVLYKSQGESSYKAIDLDGYQTDANGLFVIGPPSTQTSSALMDDNHWFEEAVGAVALHKPLKKRLSFDQATETKGPKSEVTVHYAGQTKTTELSGVWIEVAKALTAGDSVRAIRLIIRSKEAEEHIRASIIQSVNAEVNHLVDPKHPSLFRGSSLSDFKKFNYEDQLKELEIRAPVLTTALHSAAEYTGLQRNIRKTRESLIPGITTAAGILLNCRSRQMNAHQVLTALALKRSGAKTTAFSHLHSRYICSGYPTIMQRQIDFGHNFDKDVKQWAEKKHVADMAEKTMLENGATDEELKEFASKRTDHGYQIVMDNVDLSIHPRHTSRQKHGTDLHMVQLIAVKNRVDGHHLPNDKPISKISEVDVAEFLPTVTDNQRLKHEWMVLTGNIIADNMPSLHWFSQHIPTSLHHDHMVQLQKKSQVVNLGVLMQNENSTDGIYNIMHHMHQYVPGHQTDTPSTVISSGDLLSCERESSCKREQQNSTTPSQCLQGLEPVIADFHALANFYQGSAADFPTGTRASSSNLVDAIAFGDENLLLIDLLTPGQSYISYTISTGENSIIRCYSRDAHDILAYTVGTPSPGVTNDCPPPPIFINEVNVLDVSSDVGQYVELSSGSIPHFPLHSLLLIFWDGTTSLSYRAVGINGKRTDENGFFLIGYRGMSAPHPDMVPFMTPTGRIKAGSNAISLHLGLEKKDYPTKTPLTKDKLVDVIVHGLDDSSTAQHLIDFFKPRAQQINEDTTWSDLEESINLCVDADNNTVYQLAHITPKAPNHCPSRPEAKLIINELNLIPSEQFIELWDLGAGFTSLDYFVVVLFGEGDVSYWSIPLTGFTTDSRGYFVMGVVSVQPRPQFLFADGFMRHTYGAVALYRASSAPSFSDGEPPSSQGLIDAIVYTNLDINPASLTAVLTPRNSAVNSTTLQTSGFSLSRCRSINPRSRKPFLPRPQSPKSLNDCPVYSLDVVINEINVEHPGQSTQEEFIELYDGGVGNVRMQYLSLVLFNGHYGDRAYLTVDLHGRRTDSNGYFVIGGQNAPGANLKIRTRGIGGFLQAGPDAVALYRAPAGAFPRGSEATTISLVDAVVYSTDESEHISLVDKLIPGGSVVLEDANHVTGDKTISRCHGNQRLNSDVYTMGWPTPGKANNCSTASRADHSSILISEVKVEVEGRMGGEFIELYDGGAGAMSLNGLLLVLFNGANQDRSYKEIDLNGYSTNAQGFFVVGTSDITPSPDLVVPNSFLQNGPDAVVVYSAPARLFPRGTIATSINMVDVIVYTSTGRDGDDSTLLNKLVPGQRSVSQYGAASDGDQSLSRCLSNHSWTMSAFTVSQATPGFPNVCPPSSVVISEIKLNGALSVAFIELYDGGLGSSPLDALSMVLYDALHSGVGAVQSLQGQSTNSNGYFLYGKPSTEWAVDLEISASFANFKPSDVSSAVALYKDKMSGHFASDSVLLDAVVYGSRNPSSTVLIDTLLGSGQKQVLTSLGFSQGETSISRCVCCMPLMSDVFDLTPPTPGQENLCIVGTTLATPSDIIINEVSPWFGGWEYVELRGPPGARLDSLSLVLAKFVDEGSPRYYFALSLDRRAIAADGIFLIGSSGVSPPPDALLPQSAGGVLRQDEGAVAIYRNSVSLFGEGVPVTNDGLVDAIVYTNVSSRSFSGLGSILTPGFSSIYTSNFSSIGTVAVPSISRCTCCDSTNPPSFTLSAQTPGMPNRCPSSAYKTTIQMQILDAVYEVWVTNPQFTSDLRKQIVSGINAECKCGFNENYLREEKLLNGSVYYQVDVLAISSSHAKLLYDSYTQFVSKMDTLKILGTDFHIDNKCFSNCSYGGDASKPEGMTGGSGSTATVVAVVVVAVVIIAIIGVSLFVYLRHRSGSLSFWKNRKDANSKVDSEFNVTNLRTLNDFDLLGTVSETRTPTDFFANPVYMYEPPRAAVTHPEPPVSVGVKGEKAKEETKTDSVLTNGASATETKRV